MEWGKLYANLPDDPRVQSAEDNGGAAWLLIQSMCYCTSAETEGFIPRTQVDRFGGPRLRQRVNALVRESLWIPVDNGYLLDPKIWNEERNLNDQAEKKRKADRERVAAKRAAERAAQNGKVSRDMSHDSRATSDATRSGDSRTLEKSREEKTTAKVVSHLQVRNAQATDDDDLISSVISAFLDRTEHLISAEEARAIIRRVLDRAAASGTPVHHRGRYVLSSIANEPDPYSLLLGDPPPLEEILADPVPERPWCGTCDERTRFLLDEHRQPGNRRCPECHPRAHLEAS